MFVNIYLKKNIVPNKDKIVFSKYKIHNIKHTNSNNLVTIDKDYFPEKVESNSIVRNNNIFDPDQHTSPTSATNKAFPTLSPLEFNIYSSNNLACTQIRSTFPNSLISDPSVNIITVPNSYFTMKLMTICTFSIFLVKV